MNIIKIYCITNINLVHKKILWITGLFLVKREPVYYRKVEYEQVIHLNLNQCYSFVFTYEEIQH